MDRLTYSQNPFEPGKPSTYALDDAGNIKDETGFSFNASTGNLDPVAFHYDYVNNYLTHRTPTTPAGPALDYGYDHFGNQVTEGSGGGTTSTNTYDAASHPSSTTTGGTTVFFTYDGLGRMASRREGANVTLFFHDGQSDQIAVETNGSGTVGTRYVLDAYRQPVGQDQGSNRSWYVTDNRGNLTQLLNDDLSAGNDIRAVFGYDPYGKPKSQLTKLTSGWDSRLHFQMAPLDPTTGNYNLGPRLLNPSINRFVGADFYAASSANVALQLDPLTGNRFMYAGANPAGLIDNGHSWRSPCFFGRIGWCDPEPGDGIASRAGRGVGNTPVPTPSPSPTLEPSPSPSPASFEVEKCPRCPEAYSYFLGKGFTDVQSAAIVGNLMAEAGPALDPSQGQIGGGGGIGLAQWTFPSRKKGLTDFAKIDAQGRPWDDFSLQLDYVWHEMTTVPEFVSARRQILKQTEINEATRVVMDKYENPGIERLSDRQIYANQVLNAARGAQT